MKKSNPKDKVYNKLLTNISERYVQGQLKASISVNTHLVQTYWEIGKYIVEFEQKRKD